MWSLLLERRVGLVEERLVAQDPPRKTTVSARLGGAAAVKEMMIRAPTVSDVSGRHGQKLVDPQQQTVRPLLAMCCFYLSTFLPDISYLNCSTQFWQQVLSVSVVLSSATTSFHLKSKMANSLKSKAWAIALFILTSKSRETMGNWALFHPQNAPV